MIHELREHYWWLEENTYTTLHEHQPILIGKLTTLSHTPLQKNNVNVNSRRSLGLGPPTFRLLFFSDGQCANGLSSVALRSQKAQHDRTPGMLTRTEGSRSKTRPRTCRLWFINVPVALLSFFILISIGCSGAWLLSLVFEMEIKHVMWKMEYSRCLKTYKKLQENGNAIIKSAALSAKHSEH